MRLVTGLSARVVLVAVVSGLVGVTVALVAARGGMRPGIAPTEALSVVTAVLLGALLVVRPLGRRTAALSAAAARLGVASEPHAAAVSPTGDELDVVLERLVAAEARIRSDGAELEARSGALGRHLGDVARDLRTPLTALQLLVEQAADTEDRAATRELLCTALVECVYLSGLLENHRLRGVLEDDWTPRASTEPEDVGALVERICARSAPLARRRGIDLDHATPDEPVTVRFDPVAFERALTNVIENAVARGDRGGHVAVAVSSATDEFTVEVVDDGPAVAPDALPGPGERAPGVDAQHRGPRNAGLGLAVTADLCARLGIDLAFARVEPQGLRVTLRAPAQTTPPEAPATRPAT